MENFFNFIAWWKVDNQELIKEANNYHSSGLKTPRGIAAMLILAIVLINGLFILLGWLSNFLVYELAIYLLLAVFVFKGYRVAIIMTMALWTLDKGYSLYELGLTHSGPISMVIVILWWAFFMRIFFFALKIENLRKKVKPAEEISNTFLSRNQKIFMLFKSGRSFLLVFLLLSIIAGVFYWFQIRPSQIKQECAQKIIKASQNQYYPDSALQVGYEFCIHGKGL